MAINNGLADDPARIELADANGDGTGTYLGSTPVPVVDSAQGKWYGDDSVLHPWKYAGGKPRISSTPYLHSIAEGDVAGHTPVRILGYNPDVDNVSEDLWPVGGAYVFPTAAMQMQVVSSSANDSAAGTGVRTVNIHYLDNTYTESEEIITMNGLTPVSTVATNILRINDMYTITAGSNGVAAGNIDVRHLSGAPIYDRLTAGDNVNQSAIYTVPLGKTLFLVGWQIGSAAQASGHFSEFRLRATATSHSVYQSGIFHIKNISVMDYGSEYFPFQLPIKLPGKTDVKVSVIADATNSDCNTSCSVEGWLE